MNKKTTKKKVKGYAFLYRNRNLRQSKSQLRIKIYTRKKYAADKAKENHLGIIPVIITHEI